MSTLLKAKCAYLQGNGTSKGAFHFSLVAAYGTSKQDKSPTYRKFNVIFFPTRPDLKLENLGIDLTQLMKNRKESYIIPKCPYSTEQMMFILPNIRKVAANYDELKHCEDKNGNIKDDKHFKDKESGQYFILETRFVVERDFTNFNEIFKDRAIMLVDEGVNKY